MDYQQIAKESRLKCLELVYKAQTSHIGSLFSCADIFAVLFEKIDLDKDKFVLSAGWKACMLYYHLWRKGRITEEELNSYCMPGSKFIGLAEPIIPEIPFSGGSMGFGLPAAVGYAMAKKLNGEEGKVYCLMSDGEQAIGTTWESALIAAHHKLDNLVVIIDKNGYQAMEKTNEVLDIEPLWEKWESFGWFFWNVDGHNHTEIATALTGKAKDVPKELLNVAKGIPVVIIATTQKGHRVSFMEDNNLFHYKAPNDEEYAKAVKELNG